MRKLAIVLLACVALAMPAGAQDAAAPAPAAPPAPTLKPFQKVQVADPENPGQWDNCTIITAHTGAYDVNCGGRQKTVRDVHVRAPGGQPVAQTAAQPVTAPYKTGDLVLVSVMSLPDDWRLCVVERNQVQSQNAYRLSCGGTIYHQQPKWVREDPDAPK